MNRVDFLADALRSRLLTPLKYIAAILIIVNVKSFPLFWHFKALSPIFRFMIIRRAHRLRLYFKPSAVKKELIQTWWHVRSPVGRNPFQVDFVTSCFASLDDCDFNVHLSNSSYAKALDYIRFEWALKYCPQLFREGINGHIALGGTDYIFLKEIPILTSYEVRISMATWGEKWIYGVAKFVSKPKNKRKPRVVATEARGLIHTPADANINTEEPDEYLRALMERLSLPALGEEPDGAIVHCVSISQLCFKVGRVTVPPSLLMALNGFGAGVDTSAYNRLQDMVAQGSARKFLAGGWREEEDKEGRWWETCLGEDVEALRRIRLDGMEGIRRTMEASKLY